jgi:hypothetical protein
MVLNMNIIAAILGKILCMNRVTVGQTRVLIFFERTAQDSACFIDIAEEKYKNMILGDHRWENKTKRKKLRLARLDWDINTGYR